MASDAERVDISGRQDVLPEELSGFDHLIRTDTKRLYGEDHEGHRTPLQDLAHVVISFAAKAAETEVEQLNPAGGAGRPERGRQPDIEALVQRLVEGRLNALTQAHEQQRQELQAEIDTLRAEVERLQKPLHERLDEAYGDRWVPREQGIAVSRRQDNGYMEDGWTTASDPYERDGEWYIRVKKDDQEEEAGLADLARAQETPPPGDEAAQRQQQREELEARISNYNGVNLDNLYQTYRQHLQHAANTNEREAFANETTRAAAMARIRSQEVSSYINSMNEEQRNALPPDAIRDLIAWLEVRDAQEPAITPAADGTTAPETNLPEGSRPVYQRRGLLGRGWDRLRRRPAREYVPTGVYAAPDGGYVRIVDEEVVEVPPAELEGHDGVARGLGAVALAGVGALAIWELLEHKYLGHSPTHEARHSGAFGGFRHGHFYNHGPSFNKHEHGPVHTITKWFNPSLGHRRTGVEVSRTIDLVGRPGNEHLVDSGKTLLGGKRVEWDSQGKLARWGMGWLRDHHYHVDWGKIQDKVRGISRFKTVVTR